MSEPIQTMIEITGAAMLENARTSIPLTPYKTNSAPLPDVTGRGLTGHAPRLLDLLWIGGTGHLTPAGNRIP